MECGEGERKRRERTGREEKTSKNLSIFSTYHVLGRRLSMLDAHLI